MQTCALLLLAALVALAASRADAKPPPRVGRWDKHEPGYYTDAFARDKMLPLASAAYSDNPQECISRKFANATVSLHVKSLCETTDRQEQCAAYTAVAHNERAIIVSFRGTENFLQLIVEVEHVVLRRKVPSAIGGRIGEYFSSVVEHLWVRGIGADVDALIKRYPDYEIWMAGHSLGGSVAAIAATKILTTHKLHGEQIKLVTYGQPRTGDTEFVAAFDKALPRAYRVVHSRDIVSHLPPLGLERYEHHMSEVWYPNKMNVNDKFIVCKHNEDKACSDRRQPHSLTSDHKVYFDRAVAAWGSKGCA